MSTLSELQDLLREAKAAGRQDLQLRLVEAIESLPSEQPQGGTIANPLASGALFGFPDELAGALGAIPAAIETGDWDLGRHYTGIRDQVRASQEAFAQRNPATSLGLEMAGGLLSGGAGLAKSGATGLAGITRTGAGLGALAGTGYSEAEDFTADAIQGGLLGGAIAPILPAAFSGARRLMSRPVQANERFARMLARDAMTPDDITANLQRMGPQATIADAGGENVRRVAETIAQSPGRGANIARNVLEARQAGQAGRIEGLFRQALGSEKNFHAARRGLEQQMKTASKPLYDAAYSRSLQITDDLKGLMPRLERAGVMRRAQKKLRLDSDVTGGNVKLFDYAKRELDDMIGTAQRSGRGNDARIYQGMKSRLLSIMDDQVPEYAQARAAYAGPAAVDDALQKGRKFLSSDSELLDELVEGMTPAEFEYFKIGAMRALRDRVMAKSDTADSVKAVFNSPLMREKIRPLFGTDQEFADFASRMGVEGEFFRNATQMLGNSATARRLSGAQDMAELGVDIASGGSGIPTALRRGARWLMQGPEARSEGVRSLLGERMFSQDPAMQQELIQGLLAPSPAPIPWLGAPAGAAGLLVE